MLCWILAVLIWQQHSPQLVVSTYNTVFYKCISEILSVSEHHINGECTLAHTSEWTLLIITFKQTKMLCHSGLQMLNLGK